MSNSLYGVSSEKGGYTDISYSERGAKAYATRHGYKDVYRRNVNHYYIIHIASRVGNKWVKV